MASCVKGPTIHAATRPADQALSTREHLVRGPSREREEENSLRPYAHFYKMGEPVDEGPGLPGTCPRDDQQRPLGKSCRCGLLGIQLRREIARATHYGVRALRLGAPLIDPGFRHERNIRGAAERAGVFSAPASSIGCVRPVQSPALGRSGCPSAFHRRQHDGSNGQSTPSRYRLLWPFVTRCHEERMCPVKLSDLATRSDGDDA